MIGIRSTGIIRGGGIRSSRYASKGSNWAGGIFERNGKGEISMKGFAIKALPLRFQVHCHCGWA